MEKTVQRKSTGLFLEEKYGSGGDTLQFGHNLVFLDILILKINWATTQGFFAKFGKEI